MGRLLAGTDTCDEQCCVRTYLQWLQDSACDTACGLCAQPLSAEPSLRLTCFGTRAAATPD